MSAAVAELKKRETKVDILSMPCSASNVPSVSDTATYLVNNAGAATSSKETLGPGWGFRMAIKYVYVVGHTIGILTALATSDRLFSSILFCLF